MRRFIPVVLTVACACAAVLVVGHAQAGKPRPDAVPQGGVAGATIPPMTTELVVGGLAFPLWMSSPPGDTDRLFIIEKRGAIRIFKKSTGVLNSLPFLDIDATLVTGGTSLNNERGLLGLAFHPDYANNRFFYVYYTANTGPGDITIARYQASAANPDFANPSSASIVYSISHPISNHNGGWLAFGPDGFLYANHGDGGSGCDPGPGIGNAQNINILLGKTTRVDVDGADNIPGNDDDDGDLGDASTSGYTSPSSNPFFGPTNGLDEIWAYGLRNPWRASFDRQTGDLYIADVGQGQVEEVNWVPANTPGINYGWKCFEGNSPSTVSLCTPVNCGPASSYTAPIHTYSHATGISITGGYVYRGCAMPALRGTYFFADFATARIFSFTNTAGTISNFTERTVELDPAGALSITAIASFAEDQDGELYMLDHAGGELFKIVPVTPASTTDLNCDGATNGVDLGILLSQFGFDGSADFNGDNIVDGIDLGILLNGWTL